jgi:hypothetical protein
MRRLNLRITPLLFYIVMAFSILLLLLNKIVFPLPSMLPALLMESQTIQVRERLFDKIFLKVPDDIISRSAMLGNHEM